MLDLLCLIFLQVLMIVNTNVSSLLEIIIFHLVGKVHEASHMFSKMQEEGIKPGKVRTSILQNYRNKEVAGSMVLVVVL